MKGSKKSIMNRVLSMFLVVLMLVTSVPVDVHAAEPSLIITNGKGEVSDTFYVGEPIYVTASSDSSDAWVGVYEDGYSANGKSYTYWYYVNQSGYQNGNTYNIYNTIPYANGGQDTEPGRSLPAGECIIALHGTGTNLEKKLTIKEKDANAPEAGITVSKTSVETGEKITINTTSYANGSWIAIYNGEVTNFDDNYSEWKYTVGYNGTNGGYDWSPLAEGKYTIALYEGDTVVDSIVVEAQGEEVEVLSTDKTSYKFGEPIMVSLNYSTANDTWVGLFRKGDTPGGANQQAFYWNYLRNISSTFNMIDDSNKENLPSERWAQYVAGEYTIILFKDGGYNVAASVDITITKEETGRVKTPPTCENNGEIVVSYSDGTTKTITAAEDELLEALGHDYDADDNGKDDWSYNGVENKTHTKTCSVCMGENGCADCENATVTESCTFDEGVVTLEPTVDANGTKTYTCSVCGGTYEEPISAKVPVGTDIFTPATCEKEGVLRTYFDKVGGNDYIDTPILPSGHDYDADDDGEDDWAHVDGSETHQKACVNCAAVEGCSDCEKAIITEACDYGTSLSVNVAENKITSVCGVCGYENVEPILFVEEEVNYGDPINVTLNSKWNGSSAWVGLYKKGESYNPDNGGSYSIYWYYQSSQPETVNILTMGDLNGRAGEYAGGEYKVVLFNNDSYTAEIEVPFKVVAKETDRVETLPTCEADGEIVVSYNDGTIKKITAAEDESLKALGHDYDTDNDGKDDWSYNGVENKTHTKTCQNEESKCNEFVRSVTENCTFGEAEITKPAVGTEAGEKTYTCSVCGGTYTEEYYDKVITGTEIIEDSTCQKEGTLRTYYSDETYTDSAINKKPCKFGDWTHIEGTEKHERVCKEDGTEAGHKEEGKCVYELTGTTNGKFTYTCGQCKHSYDKVVLSTDKTSYKFGDAINVSFDYTTENETWVGLYRKGDTPGVQYQEAFYWNYLSELSSPFNMIASANRGTDLAPIRWAQYVAGEYTIILFADGGYTIATSVDITITKEETSRNKIEPTCEDDGQIVITYSDNTTETITAEQDETLAALGHAYPEEWTFDKEHKKHTKVCQNEEDKCNEAVRTLTESCTFGEPEITKEPVGLELGEKKFTCSVCKGSYTESFTDKTIIGEEIIEPATCEKNGVKRYYYEGGYFDVTIDMIGHSYSECKHIEGTKTHSQTCVNDATHIVVDDCEYGKPVVRDNSVIYTCKECNGEYVTSILTSDKTVYDIDDPINITAFCENKGSWVGLYKKGDKYGEGAGTIFSMRWYYVVNDGIDRNGATIDISSSAYIGDRQDPIVAGDYYVVLFSDGGYDEIARVEFSIVGDTTETEYTLDINGKVYDTGAKLYFEENDDIKLTISAEGSLGESWVGVYTNEMGIDTDFTNITSAYWQWLKDIKGKTLNLKNEMTLIPGDYSIVIFSDGGKSNPRKVVNFSIAQNENDANIIKQPTCDEWGSKYVEYENGTSAYVPIEPLGHDVKEWTYNKEDRVHFGTCQRTGCGKEITENCQFDDGILIEENEDGSKAMLYTCETCEGTYTEGYTEALPFTESVVRIFGKNRIKTAMLVADQYKELMNAESFDNVIIASGDNFADALSGTYLAKEKNAPILMYQKRYANDLCEYITANLDKDGTIYILGGVAAIPEELDESLKEFEVKRLAGDNRYDTNLKILKEAGVKGNEILVCTGKDFADGLSASAVGKPILLVNNRTNKLSDEQKELLKSLSVKNFYIIGGENAVDEAYEVELSYYGATERIGGRTRYETSVMIAERFFDNPEVAVLAYAKNFPDGLCGGPLAMALNAPLILTATNKTTNAEAYLNNYDITGGIVLGGDGLISDDSVDNIFDMQENDEIIVVQ